MILITGPDGFVGKEVCCELLRRGFNIRGGRSRVAPMLLNYQSVVVGEIGPGTDWVSALAGVDQVIHLAALVHRSGSKSNKNISEFRKINVEGTRRLAESAADSGVRQFIFLSSIKVNGDNTNSRSSVPIETGEPFTEDDEPCPEDSYGISKMEAEEVLRSIEKRSGMIVTILRSPLIYGPGVKANFLKLLRLVDMDIPLPFGSVKNKRSLIGLTNVVDLMCCCIDHPGSGGTFLVSDGEDVSTPELVLRIARSLGKRSRFFTVPEWLIKAFGTKIGEVLHAKALFESLQIDSSRIRKTIGWKAPCSMDQELVKVAYWYRGTNKKRDS